MKRRLLALVAAASLCGCATANSYSKARTSIERAADAYDRIRGSADAIVGRLPEPAATRARLALAIADAAMVAARRSGTPVEQEAALRQLAGDVAGILLALPRR